MKRYALYARDAIRLRRSEAPAARVEHLLVKGIEGLCNRLWYLLYAAAYADRFGWQLSVDWTDGMYAPAGVNAFERLFDAASVQPLPTTAEEHVQRWGKVFPQCWQDATHVSPQQLALDIGRRTGKTLDQKHLIRPLREVLLQPDPTIQTVVGTGYWPNWRDLQVAGIGFDPRKLASRLNPSRVCRQAIDRAVPAGLDCIGVHVRRTDAPDQLPIQQYWRLVPDDDRPVFLCTDDVSVEKSFRSRFGDRILPVDRTYLSPGLALHLHAGENQIESMAIEAVRDLYALSRCGTIIHGRNSSFSRFAVQALASPQTQTCLADHRVDKLKRSCARRVQTLRRVLLPNPRRVAA